MPRVGLSRVDDDVLLGAVVVLFVVLSPMLGVVLALLGAWNRSLRNAERARNVFVALALVGVVLALLPAVRYGLFPMLLG